CAACLVGRGEYSKIIEIRQLVLLLLFFFFQAEDGIRDWSVTGVQTCALPIWTTSTSTPPAVTGSPCATRPASTRSRSPSTRWRRSEERRVGKECRSRGARED